jgi:hypothetical protein
MNNYQASFLCLRPLLCYTCTFNPNRRLGSKISQAGVHQLQGSILQVVRSMRKGIRNKLAIHESTKGATARPAFVPHIPRDIAFLLVICSRIPHPFQKPLSVFLREKDPAAALQSHRRCCPIRIRSA